MKNIFKLFLLLVVIFFSNCVSAKELKFAQFSDIYLSIGNKTKEEKKLDETAINLKKAIKEINKDRSIKFVVFTGDSINKPNKKDLVEFLKIANKLNKPYYIVVGNQEVFRHQNFDKKKFMQTVSRHNSKMAFKNANYVFKPNKDFVFIVVDGANEFIPSKSGYFKPETLEWLDMQLTKYQNKKVVLVQHFPIIPPTSKSTIQTLEVEKYFNVINSYDNIIAIISGHFHKNAMIYRKGIYHMSTPAFSQNPFEYKVITINYEPKYLFSTPSEYEIEQELFAVEDETNNKTPDTNNKNIKEK